MSAVDPDICWNAVQRRDAAADGRFVYAVRTTGVYCRPSCAARPKRENVAFYASAAEAAAAGFRPCTRCQPDAGVLRAREELGPGAVLLRGFAERQAEALLKAITAVAAEAPFRRMVTPGGFRMSVAMTNGGPAGWVTDRRGYRYQATDPDSGKPWPAMPAVFADLAASAAAAAGYAGFEPDAALLNRYEAGTKLSLHRDENERDVEAPIVSLSLGLPATFLFGGLARADKQRRVPLRHGDVVVWGGPTRFAYHGIAPLKAGEHRLTGPYRYNITLRRAL